MLLSIQASDGSFHHGMPLPAPVEQLFSDCAQGGEGKRTGTRVEVLATRLVACGESVDGVTRVKPLCSRILQATGAAPLPRTFR